MEIIVNYKLLLFILVPFKNFMFFIALTRLNRMSAHAIVLPEMPLWKSAALISMIGKSLVFEAVISTQISTAF
jgi:hypothetical protein